MSHYIPYVFIAVGFFISAMNWLAFYRGIVHGDRHSLVILVGGALLAFGIGTMPHAVSAYWWIGFFLDFGSIPGLSYALWKYLKNRNHEA